MASPAAEHRQSDPPPHGSARPNPCGHGADPGHAEPRQRSSWGQEEAEHGDGAEATRPFPCSGRPAPSATEENSSLPFDQASRCLIRAVQAQGEVHDTALKAAEMDATKRARSTFGKPFGLALYGTGKLAPVPKAPALEPKSIEIGEQHSFARDDTTSIPRPSRYYGRRHDSVSRDLTSRQRIQGSQRDIGLQESTDTSIIAPSPDLFPGQPDKSVLTIAEPKRLRDKAHLKFVASQPCLVCGRQPSDPHHLRFAQPRALGLKVSDEFTVPLCRGHHRQLHQAGNEVTWWELLFQKNLRRPDTGSKNTKAFSTGRYKFVTYRLRIRLSLCIE
jgi:hypothetical protein